MKHLHSTLLDLPKTNNPQYPLEKNYTKKETEKKKNVVVIIVESLTISTLIISMKEKNME